MRLGRVLWTIGLLASYAGAPILAQPPAAAPSARLREVLPPDVAERVLALIAAARARDLPAAALENRALKFAARGVAPADIERSVAEQAARMQQAKDALDAARDRKAADDEIDAGAEALRRGVDGKAVSELAKSAPPGRSLAVPLYVIGGLIDRGLPSDDALARVLERLKARASDRELEQLPAGTPPNGVAGGHGNRPAETGRDLSATKKPGSAGGTGGGQGKGPPAGVPASGGGRGKKPAVPPGQTKPKGKP